MPTTPKGSPAFTRREVLHCELGGHRVELVRENGKVSAAVDGTTLFETANAETLVMLGEMAKELAV